VFGLHPLAREANAGLGTQAIDAHSLQKSRLLMRIARTHLAREAKAGLGTQAIG